MLKRTLYFGNPVYLKVKDEQLVIENKESGEIHQAPVEDIGFVLIDHPQITITTALIQKLAENNVAVVYCNQAHHPASMLFHLDTNSVQGELFRLQIDATEPLKKSLWKQTIETKISNQALLLKKLGKEYRLLEEISHDVKSGDPDNREGTASRFYWQRLFNNGDFTRERFGDPPNNMLNYGYAILRASVARALVSSGLLPTLGIHHHNRYNAYCLADDIMEPYRPFVDEVVYNLYKREEDEKELNKEKKAALLGVLTNDTRFNKINRPLMVGLSMTTASLSRCFAGKQRTIEYPEMII